MGISPSAYELLLFLVNNLQTNADVITAQVITGSTAIAGDQAMAKIWGQMTAENQEDIAADVHHILSGISEDLAFLF